MTFIKTPTKGMRDLLPSDMELREYVLNLLKDTYKSFGFTLVSTPSLEHIENLTGRNGGDNEKLIFKVLKRGEKLDINNISDPDDLVDSGLRYDLTVPLTRFYANNMNLLPKPFRALQIGNVWRAERNQKGRFREFMQCDLDILGEKSNIAEIELISAVITFLKKLDFKGFTIRINDRRILEGIMNSINFPVEKREQILIELDKLDKIGIDGVKEELLNLELDSNSINKFLDAFNGSVTLESFSNTFSLDESIISNLKEIMDTSKELTNSNIVFDPTLVRGMGYYTGPIFEIGVEDVGFSIGGGGRYDKLVEKFINAPTPAVGFSVGFERLTLILNERGFKVPTNKEKIAYLISDDADKKEVFKKAMLDRESNKIVKIVNKSKNFKFQAEELEKEGYIIK